MKISHLKRPTSKDIEQEQAELLALEFISGMKDAVITDCKKCTHGALSHRVYATLREEYYWSDAELFLRMMTR